MTESIVYTKKGKAIKVNKISDEYYIRERKAYYPCFDDSFLNFATEQFKERMEYKWTCEIIITGERRGGKSSLAQIFARKIDPNFPQENIVFRIEEYAERFNALAPGDPSKNYYPQIIIDEAGYDLFAQEWYTHIQKEIVKQTEISGAKYIILYLIAPEVWLINSKMRSFGHYWIDLDTEDLERGIAVFYEIKRNRYAPAPFYDPLGAFLFNEPERDEFMNQYEARKMDFILHETRELAFGKTSSYKRHLLKILFDRQEGYLTLTKRTQYDVARILNVDPSFITRLKSDFKETVKLP